MRRSGRTFLICGALALFCLSVTARAQDASDTHGVKPSELTREAILNDPETPVGGNPKGDVTIVAFEDYNCPYCKKSEPALQKLIRVDGHIRLVYKDWPILSKTSVYAAIIALGAKYQGKYEVLHRAFMQIRGHADNAMIDRAVHESGVDIARLNKDLAAHSAEIHAIIRRNNAQALGMGFQGTPVFLVGPYLVAAALDYNGFRKVVAQAREGEGK
ncbi:MAG: DsbA family protein [Beijerinckiaceae bacterium]|nr:MAG: DsbA family protein [Beijerinckiaceae bacterium]